MAETTHRTLVAYVLPEAHTRARGSFCRSPSVGGGFIETALPIFNCKTGQTCFTITFVATGPAARCPPVCQGTAFPLRRNVEIIHYRADGRKGEVISTAQQRHDFLPFEEHGSHHIDDGVI